MNRVSSDSAVTAALIGAAALALAVLPGCAPFDVNVGTDDPLKVELSMDVHVYQHDETDEDEKEKRLAYKEVIKNRRDRTEEIRKIKNNRLVVETREGLLAIRNLPGGQWGRDVKAAVEAENADRNFLIAHEAAQKGVAEDEVRRIQWRHWQRKSFPGEWIEVESEKTEGEYEWAQKKGAAEDSPEEGDAADKPEDSAEKPEDPPEKPEDSAKKPEDSGNE